MDSLADKRESNTLEDSKEDQIENKDGRVVYITVEISFMHLIPSQELM